MAVKKTFEFFFAPLLKKFFQDMGRDPNNLEMILLRQKAGQLFKDSNKVINFPQKRSFKEEIEAMNKSGDIVDEKDMVISEKITDRDMFKDASKRFNKTDMVADSVARITSMEPVAALKEANKVIGRKGVYKNLDETQSKKIA